MSDNKAENMFQIDEFGRVIILNEDLMTKVSGALSDNDMLPDDNNGCGDGACRDNGACT